MKYDITKKSAPAMPNLGKGTECIKLLLSQTSKDMHEPLVPMLFPVLGAHISGAEFQYPDRSWKETCGMMANLVAETGGNNDTPGERLFQQLQQVLPRAMSTKDHQRPLRMQYLCTIKKTTAYKGPDNGVGTPKQRRCFTGRSHHSQRWGRNT